MNQKLCTKMDYQYVKDEILILINRIDIISTVSTYYHTDTLSLIASFRLYAQ